jgi:hypothetical protein
MIALTDQQLEIVMAAATPLPPEKRALLLHTCNCMAAAAARASVILTSGLRYLRRCADWCSGR